jgi:hypothetical protein
MRQSNVKKEVAVSNKIVFSILLVLTLILSACNLASTATPLALPTSITALPTVVPVIATLVPVNTLVPTTTLPAVTATMVPSNTPPPVVNTATPSASPGMPNYIDDRSTPSQVIISYYNAIDRQEYLRAYSYYSDPATSLGSFSSFINGYQNTVSVDLVFGPITGDPGMSQIYYTVPVILKAITKNNVHTNYAACYVVHESNPDVYGAPPISPMGIASGSAKVSSLNASDVSVLANACSAYPTGGLQSPPIASANNLSIDKTNFVDNRSGPIETVSSLLNSINLKQYVRAYSYYQDPATYPGLYDPYAAGYASTDSITVTFGTVQSEGAAGSLYYKVPLAEVVLTTSSTTQTFVGCYTLRLGQPANQTTPPYQPMGITAGNFTQVANGTNVTALLSTACN